MAQIRGLRADIAATKFARNCKRNEFTREGVTEVTIIGTLDLTGAERAQPGDMASRVQPLDRLCQHANVTEDAPPVILVYRERSGPGERLVHAEPFPAPAGRRYKAGGSFLHGDSRLARLAGFYGAVSFHEYHED